MSEKEMRELDAWIMIRVFGGALTTEVQFPHRDGYDLPNGEFVLVNDAPKFTTDSASAMLVLEKCVNRITTTIRQQSDGSFIIWFDKPAVQENYVKADTLPLAIALFARKLFSK